MNRRCPILLFSVMVFLLGIGTVSLAAKKPPAGKPKPKSNNVKLGSIGTSQLPGQWCDFGKTYTLGKANAINLTLTSAEYTIHAVSVGDRFFWPQERQKLLVLHYTLHNPLPAERRVDHTTIDWTAVDANDQNKNQEYLSVGVQSTGKQLNQVMKPAQKIQVYAIIRVISQGEIPKLMAANHEDTKAPIARYDLRGKVKPLEPPYADPNDKTGATMVKEVPGVIGTFYTTGIFDSKVDAVDFANPPLDDEGYESGNVYVIVTLEFKLIAEGSSGLTGSGAPTSDMVLKDVDGISYQYKYGPMPVSSTRHFSPIINQGDSLKFRVAFSVPKGVGLKSLTLKEFYGYPVVIDFSAYKTP